MFNKKLKKRISALENYLGIAFCADGYDDEGYYLEEKHGKIKSMKDDLKEVRDKLKLKDKDRFLDL